MPRYRSSRVFAACLRRVWSASEAAGSRGSSHLERRPSSLGLDHGWCVYSKPGEPCRLQPPYLKEPKRQFLCSHTKKHDNGVHIVSAQPWRIPAVQIWGKICHKYEGMTDMLTGTMMEELANIITCVTGDARQRRTIYEADQDFERFGKTLIANFKDTATLWAFLRASLRQCHIHKLSKVGKDKAAWAKADEYLTNLMDSDTMLTLENTNDAIKRAENYMQRQDTDGDKRVAFSSAVDDSTDGPDEVNTLRAKVLALEAKLDSFSHEQKDGGNKRKKPARKNEKECTYCKKAGKWFQGHEESECHHKKKDEAT
jgi:hypothetical protein